MKRIYFVMLFLLATVASFAQNDTRMPNYGYEMDRLRVVSDFQIPIMDQPRINRKDSLLPQLVYKRGDSTGLWLYNPDSKHWRRTGGSTLSDTLVAKAVSTGNIFAPRSTDPDYEIAVFPDLQNMVPGGQPTRNAAGRAMFQWVKDSADDYNIKAVIGVGDITEEGNNTPEWDTVSVWYNMLDAVSMPYMTPPGNHDYNNRFTMFSTGRDLTKYNQYFGATRYSGKPYFVDVFKGKYENSLYAFNAGARKYAVFVMEFFPTDSAMAWVGNKCDSIYNADPTVQVILTMHAYMRTQGERSTDTSPSSVNAYSAGAGGVGADNSGDEIWDKLGKKKKNIRFIFSGHFVVNGVHVGTGFTKRIVSTGENGNVVDQIYVNYQDASDYGNGYMMRLRFKPSEGTATVSFWSPYEAQNDPLYPSYVISDPDIQVQSSVGVTRDLTVYNQLRADGPVKFSRLVAGQMPYTGFDGELLSSPNLRYTLEDSASLMIGQPTYDPASKFQVNGGANIVGKLKLGTLTAMRIPFLSAGGYLTDNAVIKLSTDSARLLIGSPSDDAQSTIQFTGGMRGTGKVFLADSFHVRSTTNAGNNPYWFQSGHTGNGLEPGNGVNTMVRLEASGAVGVANWWNILRMRPPGGMVDGSYMSTEMGLNTNAYNHVYWRWRKTGTGSSENWSEFITWNGGDYNITPRTKFFAEGSVQIGGIESATRQASAIAEVISTTKGFLLPRMTGVQMAAISSPATSLLIYNTDSTGFCYYNGSSWVKIGASTGGGGGGGTGWGLTGNTVTVGASTGSFIGSTNNVSMRFRTNNVEAMHIDSSGNVGIGTVAYNSSKLFVNGNIDATTYSMNGTSLALDVPGIVRVLRGVSGHDHLSMGESGGGYNNVYSNEHHTFVSYGGTYFGALDASGLSLFTGTTATAKLHIAAGSATANTAPIKLTSGTVLSTPENGAIEYDGVHYYGTAGGSRLQLDNSLIFQSTYTPTLTNTTNVAASTAYVTSYTRIGDEVEVWGAVSIDATTPLTITEMGFSLPIASNLGNTEDLSGTAVFEDNTAIQIKADVTNDRAVLRGAPQTSTNNKYSFHFKYKIIS